jgi:phosphopentomutase
VVLRLAWDHDFVLVEHFLLDELGHARDHDAADAAIRGYDTFLRTVAAGLCDGAHLLVVSDHGNVEDLSVRTHTRNPVPFLAFGPLAARMVERVSSLVDVRAAIFAACSAEDPGDPAEAPLP